MTKRRDELEALDEAGFEERRGASPLEWATFVLRAAWRRKLLVTAVLVLGGVALVLYYGSRAPLYRAQARLLAQKQDAVPSVLRLSGSNDAPTRTAWELVHQRDNLATLVKEANLLAPGAVPASGILPESLHAWVRSLSPTAEPYDRTDALVMRLDRELNVSSDERTVTISIDWPDPQQAHRIVDAAVQNFVEARHVQEITAIDEVISLLQGRVSTLRAELDAAVAQAQRSNSIADSADLAATRVRTVRQKAPSEELARLKSLLDAKERAVRDVEEFRRRRLADLQAQLDEKRGVYSDTYPAVVTLRQDIEALSLESPQIAALRAEEKKLRDEYAARATQAPSAEASAAASTGIAPPRIRRADANLSDEEEHVKDVRYRYQQMVERVNAAQVDLDAARAAFKYRYNVIWPADVDKKPVAPNPRKIFGLGGVAVVLLALGLATALDLVRGRVLERWQVEESLDLPVFGEVRS